MEEPWDLLKNPVKRGVRIGEPERKVSNSSNGLNTTANNTNPIMCAVCGSKEYITLHLHDKVNYSFGLATGWNSSELPKKHSLSTEFAQTCGPLSPISQALFPQLSLFHLPSSIYYSHYNSQFRIPSTPCVPIEKYFGSSVSELNASKAAAINSESTMYRGNGDTTKKKRNTTRASKDSFREDASSPYKNGKEESRRKSAFTNTFDVRNFPLAMHPPWMGNICPIFPYTYAPFALPLNHPLVPIYLPMPGKWQSDGTGNEEDTIDSSASNSPVGDGSSVKNEGEKKSEQKDENNPSEYDFDFFARDLVLQQKSNYGEEDEVEINLDEITSSLKLPEVNSEREINSEKFFNSREKWNCSDKDDCLEKDKIQNWMFSSEINMQDCCVRTLSNENLWYEARDGEKKNWGTAQEYYSKDKALACNSKDNDNETDRIGGKDKICDGTFYEAKTVWSHDKGIAPKESESKTHTNWKKSNDRNTKVNKPTFGQSPDITSASKDKRNENWCKISKSELNDEIEIRLSEGKLGSLAETDRLRNMKIIRQQESKLDVRFNDFAEESESPALTEKFGNIENKSSGLIQQISSLNTDVTSKTKKDEKTAKSFALTSSKYESLKIPVFSPRKIKNRKK